MGHGYIPYVTSTRTSRAALHQEGDTKRVACTGCTSVAPAATVATTSAASAATGIAPASSALAAAAAAPTATTSTTANSATASAASPPTAASRWPGALLRQGLVGLVGLALGGDCLRVLALHLLQASLIFGVRNNM